MIKKSKKALYLTLIGFLTCTAASATYWQSTRYTQSKKRWQIIAQQLSKPDPDPLSSLPQNQRYPLKYVQVQGVMDQKFMLVSRARDGRMGYIVVRAIQYNRVGDGDGGDCRENILAVEGWIPEGYTYVPTKTAKKFRGILRQKQKSDYLHKKMKQSDIQKFNINTFINIQKAQRTLNLPSTTIQDYYLQILKDLSEPPTSHEESHYPYQYSVDNFQLPYLTPDKHRAYAMFWGLTTMVGVGAMLKVIRMK